MWRGCLNHPTSNKKSWNILLGCENNTSSKELTSLKKEETLTQTPANWAKESTPGTRTPGVLYSSKMRFGETCELPTRGRARKARVRKNVYEEEGSEGDGSLRSTVSPQNRPQWVKNEWNERNCFFWITGLAFLSARKGSKREEEAQYSPSWASLPFEECGCCDLSVIENLPDFICNYFNKNYPHVERWNHLLILSFLMCSN